MLAEQPVILFCGAPAVLPMALTPRWLGPCVESLVHMCFLFTMALTQYNLCWLVGRGDC